MWCLNEDHYPTDRPLTFLTIDPRLHFPDEHGGECFDHWSPCYQCGGAGRLSSTRRNGAVVTRRCDTCKGHGGLTEAQWMWSVLGAMGPIGLPRLLSAPLVNPPLDP